MVDPSPKKDGKLTDEQRYNIMKGWAKEQGAIGLANVKLPVDSVVLRRMKSE